MRNHSAHPCGRPTRRIESSCSSGTRARSAGRRMARWRRNAGLATGATYSPNIGIASTPSTAPRPKRTASVYFLVVEVHRLRTGLEAQVEPGTAAHEAPEPRHQPAGREGGGRAQRDRARAVAATQQAHPARQPVEARAEVFGGQLPLLGEHETARGAPEQRDAEVALEAADLVADRAGVTCNSRAARVKLSRRAAASKARSAVSGGSDCGICEIPSSPL